MQKIEDNVNYEEGFRLAQDTIKFIDRTVYGTLEEAIKVKTKLIENFEETLGFTREIPKGGFFDRNYSYNLGMLEGFKKEIKP